MTVPYSHTNTLDLLISRRLVTIGPEHVNREGGGGV